MALKNMRRAKAVIYSSRELVMVILQQSSGNQEPATSYDCDHKKNSWANHWRNIYPLVLSSINLEHSSSFHDKKMVLQLESYRKNISKYQNNSEFAGKFDTA